MRSPAAVARNATPVEAGDARPAVAPRPFGRFGFQLVVLLVFLSADPGIGLIPETLEDIQARSGTVKCAVYVLAYVGASVLAGLFLMHRRPLVRGVTTLLVFVFAFLDRASINVTGHGIGLWEAKLLFHEAEHAGDVLETYRPELWTSLCEAGVAVVILLAARWWLRCVANHGPLRGAIVLLLGVGLVGAVVAKTDGEVSSFPCLFQVPVVSGLALWPEPVSGGRLEPFFAADTPPLAQHVVVIVDESVRGDMLGLNGGPPTTPFLSSFPSLVNFGVACSSTNSSAPSNMVLQSGITVDEMIQDCQQGMRLPTVFQYARAAGARTHLLAGQIIRRWYYSSPHDLQYLDVFRDTAKLEEGTPRHAVDSTLASWIEELTAGEGTTFTYVIKLGAHVPYSDKRPPGYWDDAPDLFPMEPEPGRRAVLNDYARTVRWTVDGFFEDLLPRLEGRDVVIVYTSDHGQSLLEGGIPATHGVGRNPPVSQANVPLFVMGTSERMRDLIVQTLGSAQPALYDKTTHFDVFPTLLELLGYPQAATRKRYGCSLLDPSPRPPRRFLSGDPFKPGARTLNSFDL